LAGEDASNFLVGARNRVSLRNPISQLKAPTSDITPNSLSKREIEVLKLVTEGKNNTEIAEDLYLSEGTVRNHVTQILSKLELRDRIAAVLWAQRHLF
jgi:DNA-binding NarL/FixJ family response regulator